MNREITVPVIPEEVSKEHIEMCAEIIEGKITWIKSNPDVNKSIPIFCSEKGDKVMFYFNPFRDMSHAWQLRDKICLEENYCIDIISTPYFPLKKNVVIHSKGNIVVLYRYSESTGWDLLQIYSDKEGTLSPAFLLTCASLYAYLDKNKNKKLLLERPEYYLDLRDY